MTADLATLGIDAPTGLLIDGQWTSGRAGTLTVLNPATEDVLAEVADASPEDALDGSRRGGPGIPVLGGDAAAAAG